MNESEHARFRKLLAAYRDLSDGERERVERHVSECARCAALLESFQGVDRDLAGLEDPEPGPQLRQRFRAAAERKGRWPRVDWGLLGTRAGQLAAVGLVILLSVGVWLVVQSRVQPGPQLWPGSGPYSPRSSATPYPWPTLTPLTPNTPGPGVADLLVDPPAPGETVEVDAYYSGAIPGALLPGGPPALPDQVVCPFSWAQALTDRPFPPGLSVLNGRHGNALPEDEPWLLAVTPEAAEPGRRTMPDLPYHARLRGHLGEPALAHCNDAARIFVVEEVVTVYEETAPWTFPIGVPEDYAAWPRHHDAALGYSVPYPPGWQAQPLDDRTVSLYPPEWPGFAVVVRVHEGETVYDQYDPGSTPPLLQGQSWSVFEQGWSFGQGTVAGSQHLSGWVVEFGGGASSERTIAAIFSAHGRTYELQVRYPLGFAARQDLLTAYSAIVEGLRLDVPPEPSPTPPVRQELGQGPFLSREEALVRLQESRGEAEDAELLASELVSEVEARRRGQACNTFFGHPEGVWLLTVRGAFEDQVRTMLLFLDAVTGAQLCGEEIAPSDVVTATPTPTPTLDNLAANTRSFPSPDGAWTAEVTVAMPRAGEGGDRYYTRMKLSRTDGALEWVPVDEWQLWALGYTTPVPFRWSRDGRYLYYTNRPVPDGCGLFVNGWDLQRVDLADGGVKEIMRQAGLWLEISPEETHLAYMAYGERGLVIRDLGTGTERQTRLDGPESYAAGHIVWSPDSRALALTLAIEPCGAGSYPDAGIWARSTSIIWVDVRTLEQRTLLREDERRFISMSWADAGTIALEDANGDPWRLDAATGELTAGG